MGEPRGSADLPLQESLTMSIAPDVLAKCPPRLREALIDLESIDDRELRFDLLLEYSDRFVEVSPAIAARPYDRAKLVPGCESEVYLWVTRDDRGLFVPHFAVENPQGLSAKALATLLQETLAGATTDEIAAVPDTIVQVIFGGTVSMGKGHGLMSMVRTLKELVAAAV